jgi:PAS domain S-box-containing protein
MTIRKKMILVLLGSSVIPLCFVAILGYYHAKKTLESVRMEGLRSIAVLKAEKIEDFFDHHKKHIIVAQQRPTLRENATLLAEFSGEFTSPAYRVIRDELDQALKTYQPVYNFINIMLVNPNGRIVYVLNRTAAPELLGQLLPDLWEGAVDHPQNGIQFSDIFADKFVANTFSMFVMAPIESFANQFVATAVFEVDMAPIYKLIQDTTGLGASGETLIAKKMGDGALFLNPLRHDPGAALQRKVVFGEKRALTIQQALSGKDGIGLSIDYRGQEVIAAWRYLPSLHWGMVAKIDASESFEPVMKMRGFIIILVVAVLIIEMFLSVMISKSISDPIRSLMVGTEAVGAGDLDYKIGTDAEDEIGQLGRAFDQMTQKLKQITTSRDELDLEVKAREKAQAALIESETRFRQLVENSLTGISIIQDGRIVYQNPEQERLLGRLPRRIIFEDMENIHHDDIGKVAQFYQNLIAGQWQHTDTEFRFYPSGKKGSLADMRWVHCRASRIEYEGRYAILLNIDEVTRAKRLENLLRIQDKMSSLGRVAAGIAHEIRNPLSGINIYLNTLKKLHHKDGSEEKVSQILDQLQSASSKIESVIRRVMDFTKSSEPQLSLININDPIEEAVNLCAVSLRKRNIKIEKRFSQNLPLCYLDAQLIEQVMLNLITNAAEALKDKPDAKTIAIVSTLAKDQIQVSVSDSGPGVPPESREVIFDPFYTTKSGSSGIGLSLSHRIIADHGGSLTALASELGGAEFRIEIPIKKYEKKL